MTRTDARAACRPAGGFTLMESLVVLVLVSLSVLVMFQMLGSYRLARERIALHAGGLDRQALVTAWFTDSVRGLHAIDKTPLVGRQERFAAMTLNPVLGSAGAPTPVSWHIEAADEGGWMLAYHEGGESQWSLALDGDEAPRFVYYTRDGRPTGQWPPASGMQELLPASIALVGGSRVWFATVLGPLEPPVDPLQQEEE